EIANGDGDRLAAQGIGEDALATLARLATPSLLKLTARLAIERRPLPPRVRAGGDSARGTRPSALAPDGRLPVHAHAALIGQSLTGPLVVDGGTFTWYVGPGWRLAVDERGDGRLTRRAGR
ncbi:MAG: hypothetical protein AB7I32_12550, partial [Gammaproteobacteria bacterium]